MSDIRTGLPVDGDVEKRLPVDRVAARVVGWRGTSHAFRNCTDEVCITEPVPMRPVPRDLENLTGLRVHRLVVAGLANEHCNSGALRVDPMRRKQTRPNGMSARWQCRCLCGRYFLRSTKVLREMRNGEHPDAGMCFQCRAIERTRNGDLTYIQYEPKP